MDSKLSSFWDKQQERLVQALVPCDMALQEAEHKQVAVCVSTDFIGQFRSLDSSSLFDSERLDSMASSFDLTNYIGE